MNDIKREESKRVSSCLRWRLWKISYPQIKRWSPYRHNKKLLTSRVGELVGPTVGLDDGCSKDREQEISCCVSKCDVEVSSILLALDWFRLTTTDKAYLFWWARCRRHRRTFTWARWGRQAWIRRWLESRRYQLWVSVMLRYVYSKSQEIDFDTSQSACYT